VCGARSQSGNLPPIISSVAVQLVHAAAGLADTHAVSNLFIYSDTHSLHCTVHLLTAALPLAEAESLWKFRLLFVSKKKKEKRSSACSVHISFSSSGPTGLG